ncbi:MAG TPA: cytochrome b N-terminal domain-containing protein [Kofleriaceae bacterium]|nr:cytochrome b N-terminal domain-containing protein [Kofleriaceae bacterium]
MSVRDWLDERTGYRAVVKHALEEPVLGGASLAYVFGSVLLFVLILQMTTGILLAFYYAPSATDAWASVANIEDRVTMGWLVRGLHHHGASAMVIVAGLHLVQTAVWGAYKRPREMNWIIGVLLLGLIMAFALTGYLLPWDQTGYWATKVATGIAGSSPMIGDQLKAAVQGGNEYGNLTLTRFFALHVFVLPALTLGLVAIHLALFRKHGVTPHWWKSEDALARDVQPFWPDQLFRDFVAMAVAFGGILAWTVHEHGARLDAPADPSSGFDARPEWYFRPLFQALKYFGGSMERIVALGAPVVVGGFLLALPFADKSRERAPQRRPIVMSLLAVGGLCVAALTFLSYREDAGDASLAERQVAAETRAQKARVLAELYGVPAAGGTSVFETATFYRARVIWAKSCAKCHEGDKREGPAIGAGYNTRAWIRGFLTGPSSELYFGRSKLADKEGAMKPVDYTGADLDALVEMVYAETGAPDIDAKKVARGHEIFEDDCSNCHEREVGKESVSAPNLYGRGSRWWLAQFIATPGGATFFGDRNAMPKIGADLSPADRDELARYITWLRVATPANVHALGDP